MLLRTLDMNSLALPEKRLAVVVVAISIAILAWLCSNSSSFWGQFAYVVAPQCLALLVLRAMRARGAAIAGTLLAQLGHLGLFDLWASGKGDDAGLAWLAYFLAVPGGIVGGAIGARLLKQKPWTVLGVVAASALLSLAGVALNQMYLCASVMQCSA